MKTELNLPGFGAKKLITFCSRVDALIAPFFFFFVTRRYAAYNNFASSKVVFYIRVANQRV